MRRTVYDGKHGLDRWRKDRPGCRTCDTGEASGNYLYMFRRRAHAGGNRVSDADGEDVGGS